MSFVVLMLSYHDLLNYLDEKKHNLRVPLKLICSTNIEK